MKKLAEELALELTIEYGDFSEKKARELTFSYADRMDVFVCASDLMAIGAMRALMSLNLIVALERPAGLEPATVCLEGGCSTC